MSSDNFTIEEGYYTKDLTKPRRVYCGLTLETWSYIAIFIVVVPFLIAIVVEIAKIKIDVESTPIQSALSDEMLAFLIENADSAGCANSLTTHPVAICNNLCEKEFCVGSTEPCSGKCKELPGSPTLDDCKKGCLCCGSYHDCLLKHGNDAVLCKNELPDCKFGDPGIPVDTPDPICLPQISTSYCPRVGCGFNLPIACSN